MVRAVCVRERITVEVRNSLLDRDALERPVLNVVCFSLPLSVTAGLLI